MLMVMLGKAKSHQKSTSYKLALALCVYKKVTQFFKEFLGTNKINVVVFLNYHIFLECQFCCVQFSASKDEFLSNRRKDFISG
jgi:VanZ family protein